mmetsp:Transcript_10930/g.17807  ORF Transcript_10930/g.17807 Transcript_10930/m.17807 type:complete len:150 (-) Transcript_10930:1440-1889(-)|eukprot:CAMPEP_0174996110 /NCGR_PEP_ID=MMETSP0005-20121125/211_1 /TAXON_ID=420556 /ORGANISM="Ochromonas sp., Strain CCMP1393" /LENGTH=149 /DNA_ID=CAMNT_0016250479 /DNA_START=37 /DNA_END=486 /DNA_ORIENTATION=+
MAKVRALRRIQKEYEKFQADAESDGLNVEIISDNVWHVSFTGAPSTIYEGEPYTLRVRFTDEYPMDSPEVVFLAPPPVHPHIYSNGHVCLNILGVDWSPALTVRSIVISILSMMSSASIKTPPEDNDRYTRSLRTNAKETSWVYHDDTV